MSAANGGRGTPPTPPQGHGSPQEIPILKEVTYSVQHGSAKTEGDRGEISYVVVEAGMPVRHTYIVEDSDKKRILEGLSGGLKLL